MAHTVWEARQLRILAKELGACVQVGMQGCAHDGFRQGVEYLQAGGIGRYQKFMYGRTNQPGRRDRSLPIAPMNNLPCPMR